MGIIISSCKGESSRKYEEVYKSKLNRPSKREQRFKTYKFSTRSNRSSIRSSKSSLNIHRSQVQNTIPKIIKQTPLNESPLSFKSKSAEVLNRQKIIYQDKSCQVELDSIKYIQTPPRKSKTKAKSKSTSPHSNRNRNKMSHRRHKHIPDFQHRHQHHHHHYHHQIQKEKRILLNLDDGRYSPTFSVFSDMDQEYTNGRIGQSVFSSLYNQVSNNRCKIVTDDPSSSLSSLNQYGGPSGSSSAREKDKFDECNQLSSNDYSDLSNFESLPLVENIDSIKCSIARLSKIKDALAEPNEDFFTLISKIDLKKNVDFFLKVLENVLRDERKQVSLRLMSEDDVLSEVEPDAVPNEVRNWLSMTFTRSVSNMKKKAEDKPKFKSVAQAIRAGIMVDRMLRRMSSSLESNVPAQVSKVLKTLNDWNFEVFAMNECSDGQALRYLGFELMQKFNILSKFKIQNLVMQNFLEAVEAGYSKYNNPYHNLIHATDVLQTTYHILNNAGLMSWLSSIEIFATFVSAIVHDYEHTGTTNNFHMQTRSEIALVYNDRAVLENYHISATFRLMINDSYNIIQELTREEYKEFRHLVIEMVLATDMSFHFTQLKTIKNMISLNEVIDKPKALSLLLHCADISHPSKHWPLHEKWTNLLVEEFFSQGDKEKQLGLPFSPLCDRNNTPIAQSQIGFINFIVEPSLNVMGDMIDKIFEQILSEEQSRTSKSDLNDSSSASEPIKKKPIERPWAQYLTENKAKWQVLAEEEKRKKEQENGEKISNEKDDKNDGDKH